MSDLSITPLPGMQIRCHSIQKSGALSHCQTGEALAGAKSGKNHYWVDIDADPRYAAELREWLQKLNLPTFVIDVLSEPPELWASQVIPLPKAVLAVIRTLPEEADSDEIAHLAALCLRNMLITFTSCQRSETGALYALVFQRMDVSERLPSPTSSGALIAWLRFHLDRTSQVLRALRHSVVSMDEAMDRDGVHTVDLEEIILAKDQLLRLLSVAEEQSECIESLSAAVATFDSSSFGSSSLPILRAKAGSTERTAIRLEKNLSDLRQRSEGYEHQMTNRRLAVLTVVSAVFMPLTLFTGIWGMNFENMPELSKPYAYPLALIFMILLAMIMIVYFRRAGWFD